MTDPSLSLQKAIRALLVADPAVTALVPASSIFDRHRQPETFPHINIGEGQVILDDGLQRDRFEVYADCHIWTRESGLVDCKRIGGAASNALRTFPKVIDSFRIADAFVDGARYLRDPSGEHAHGVLSVLAVMRRESP